MIKSWREFSVKIRRRETPFYDRLYRLGKSVRSLAFPSIKPLHSLFYHEWVLRTSAWHNFWRIVYYEPMFKTQCVTVGPGFRMHYAGNGSTKIFGNLQVHIGADVTIFDNSGFTGIKSLDAPELYIGDGTYIGPLIRIMVGKRVTIGRNCVIASRMITDNPGHSIKDVIGRIEGNDAPGPENIFPIHIGDFCFLGLDTIVYPGVTIGDGVVASVGTHINRDFSPFVQVAGNPAKIVRKLPIPEKLADIVGKEKYNLYVEEHKRIDL